MDSIHNASRQYLMSKGKFAFAEKTNVTSRTTELVRCEQRLLDACQGEDTSMPCFLVHSFEEVIHKKEARFLNESRLRDRSSSHFIETIFSEAI